MIVTDRSLLKAEPGTLACRAAGVSFSGESVSDRCTLSARGIGCINDPIPTG